MPHPKAMPMPKLTCKNLAPCTRVIIAAFTCPNQTCQKAASVVIAQNLIAKPQAISWLKCHEL